MKLGIVAMAALLVVGVLAVEGVAENAAGEGLLTGSAQASCVEVDNQCVWLCPGNGELLFFEFECTM